MSVNFKRSRHANSGKEAYRTTRPLTDGAPVRILSPNLFYIASSTGNINEYMNCDAKIWNKLQLECYLPVGILTARIVARLKGRQ